MGEENIGPALSADEWEAGHGRGFWIAGYVHVDGDVLTVHADHYKDGACEDTQFSLHGRHALAALALHGQPYGFTREDVVLVLDAIGMEWDRFSDRKAERALEAKYRALAARIAALLPPESPE